MNDIRLQFKLSAKDILQREQAVLLLNQFKLKIEAKIPQEINKLIK